MDKRILLVAVIAIIGVAGVASLLYISGAGSTALPQGCKKPADGFLIIASDTGFNDSVDKGAFATWPVVTVQKGTTVNFVVCNIDREVHSFQVDHYFANGLNAIDTGQVLRVSFVANETGTFKIYCQIFCVIHAFMQNGQLTVV